MDVAINVLHRYMKVKNIYTKQSNKRNNQNSKDKIITWNKETQMTGQRVTPLHESKKYRYQAVKQKEQSKLKRQDYNMK